MKLKGRDLFNAAKPLLRIAEKGCRIFPKKYRLFLFVKALKKAGYIGIAQRYILLRTLAANMGDNVRINENCYIYNPENLSIGNNVSIWSMTYIECSGNVSIGDDVSIAHGVTIMSEEHRYEASEVPIKNQGKRFADVIIESNVWIGAKATILAGVTIQSGSIIGAGAVVTRDVPKNTIVAGVPAKRIKTRC